MWDTSKQKIPLVNSDDTSPSRYVLSSEVAFETEWGEGSLKTTSLLWYWLSGNIVT